MKVPKRKRAASGYTLEGKVRVRRTPAVGKELDRILSAAITGFEAAGTRGLTRLELADAIDAGSKGSDNAIARLRNDKRIYISTWRRGSPAYAAGNLADAPRPATSDLPSARLKQVDILEVAKQEIEAAHAQWAATWVPHRDPAAQWIGGAA